MSEYVTAQQKLTFKTGLPLGRHATFTHEGQRWIAVPQDKYRAIVTVTDRLLGAIDKIRGQATRWVSAHPEDAQRVLMLLRVIAHTDTIINESRSDKAKAQTA